MGRAFRVNTYQDNWQRNPDVTTFADGSVLIVYESYINDYDDGPSATVVLGQRYDAEGRRMGGEFVIDGIDGTRSADARVTTLSDGGYAVTWSFDNYDDILTTRERVYVQAFDADGTARTGVLRVDDVAANDAILPEIVATADGGFKVLFGTDRSTDLFDQIYSQQFAADGSRIGGNRLVNTNEGEFDEFLARSAVLANGTSITIWNSEGSFPTRGDLDSNGVRGTIHAADGTVVRGDFSLAINYGTVGSLFGSSGDGYDVAALQGGGFVVTNKNYDFELGLETEDTSYYTMLRFFDAAGNATGVERIVDASDDLPGATRVAQLATGEIVVVWDQDDDTRGFVGDTIYGRIFAADGTPLTGRFDVAPTVPSYFDQDDPEIAALPGGGFIVTFMSDYIDADDDGVAARIFGRGTGGADILGVDATGMLWGLAGADRLTGDGRGNRIYGGVGADSLMGRAGQDALFGGADRDRLFGDRGNDRLEGGTGGDVLSGGAGADRVAGGRGRDVADLGQGADVYTDTGQGGFLGQDRVSGGLGNDRIATGGGDDRLEGGRGNDSLEGGGGRDILDGGAGTDRIRGGSGADTFVFGVGSDLDLILDFSRREGDMLRLDRDLWDGRLSPGQVVDRFARIEAGDVVFDFGGDDLVLEGLGSRLTLADHIEIF